MSAAPLNIFKFEPITREQIRDYCEASGDFNRIHTDDAFAKEAGLPSVIAHGMLSMGLAARALHEWNIDIESLKTFDAKFKDKVLPGDLLIAELLTQDSNSLAARIVNQTSTEVITVTAKW